MSAQTVRNWATAGKLPAVKRGVRTMIPRDAVVREIERSRVPADPGESEPSEHDLAWRRELLAALPADLVARLEALHDRMEDGRELTPDEVAEMARLERAMADAAARHLRRIIGHGRAGAA